MKDTERYTSEFPTNDSMFRVRVGKPLRRLLTFMKGGGGVGLILCKVYMVFLVSLIVDRDGGSRRFRLIKRCQQSLVKKDIIFFKVQVTFRGHTRRSSRVKEGGARRQRVLN